MFVFHLVLLILVFACNDLCCTYLVVHLLFSHCFLSFFMKANLPRYHSPPIPFLFTLLHCYRLRYIWSHSFPFSYISFPPWPNFYRGVHSFLLHAATTILYTSSRSKPWSLEKSLYFRFNFNLSNVKQPLWCE